MGGVATLFNDRSDPLGEVDEIGDGRDDVMLRTKGMEIEGVRVHLLKDILNKIHK